MSSTIQTGQARREPLSLLVSGAVTEMPTACPRCGESIADEAYYGVCEDCRSALRAAFAGPGREIEAVEYEPKMNVTPNAVATKD